MLFFSLVISLCFGFVFPEIAVLKEGETSSRDDFDHRGKVHEEGAIKATSPLSQTFPLCFRQSTGGLG